MKIKEVIAKTGLTDRAIRLYIENGLVTPNNEKSYTGRNNYNFTQSDVEVFEQIALLRKADFSLEQIKILKLGGESAKEV
ncbi:MAG: MerR family transcriptional regulator, partial [Clostridia bacterium]|nr:MerR family transcriptional regulator [Clostridia bacterium]